LLYQCPVRFFLSRIESSGGQPHEESVRRKILNHINRKKLPPRRKDTKLLIKTHLRDLVPQWRKCFVIKSTNFETKELNNLEII
jgi:hypothetical protein